MDEADAPAQILQELDRARDEVARLRRRLAGEIPANGAGAVVIGPDWRPTPEAIAALPEPLRNVLLMPALRPDEGDRQLVLMALAHLATGRPGWDAALSSIAKQIDNSGLYEAFKRLRYPEDREGVESDPNAAYAAQVARTRAWWAEQDAKGYEKEINTEMNLCGSRHETQMMSCAEPRDHGGLCCNGAYWWCRPAPGEVARGPFAKPPIKASKEPSP